MDETQQTPSVEQSIPVGALVANEQLGKSVLNSEKTLEARVMELEFLLHHHKHLGSDTTQPLISSGEIELNGSPQTDISASGLVTRTFNAGSAVIAGQGLYMDTNGKWQVWDADTVANGGSVLLAIALEKSENNVPIKVALPGSFVRKDSWGWNKGAELYVSTTSGELTETNPNGTADVVRIVGHAVAANVIFFLPETGWIELV